MIDDCPTCGKKAARINGSDYNVVEFFCPEGHAWGALKTFRVEERLRSICFPSEAMYGMTFENSKRDLRGIEEWADHTQVKGLLLHGPMGSGKTYAACALLNKLISNGKQCLFTDISTIYNDLCSSFEDRNKKLKRLNSFYCVVIDDFGTNKIAGKMADTTFEVINTLYRACTKTIVTTNLSPSDMLKSGDRSCSRILDMCVPAEFHGDFRVGEQA